MSISEEIATAAKKLGRALSQTSYVRPYLEAIKETQEDPVASVLEKREYELYSDLINCQQVCEQPATDQTRAFLEIREQALSHPLIVKRNNLHRQLNPYLREVVEEINFVLGVDFADLARSS
jgi:cell fate (sporulation/competence/biofilm development) regulator YlbF (YheA/YmcA/DUF963 family)